MTNRCEFCNQAVWVLRAQGGRPVMVNAPGEVRWVEFVNALGAATSLIVRQEKHYQEHVETCTSAVLLRRKLDAAEAKRQEELKAARAMAEEEVEAGE